MLESDKYEKNKAGKGVRKCQRHKVFMILERVDRESLTEKMMFK